MKIGVDNEWWYKDKNKKYSSHDDLTHNFIDYQYLIPK